MLRWLRSLFAWRDVRSTGVWAYRENTVTGQRAARQLVTGGYQPLDWSWLDEGCGHPLVNGAPAWRSAQGQRRIAYLL